MSRVIGIDLGTTNSCVALLDAGRPSVIANAEGARTTPSMVAFQASGEILVGHIAKRQAVTNPEETVFSVKRLIGRRFESPEAERFRGLAPFVVEAGEAGDSRIRVGGRSHTPQEISAMVLARMRESVSDFVGEPVTSAVITVPAHFDDSQRQATQDAGRIAGLEVLRIINEPTAAALAFGVEQQGSGRIAVFDLGGGTFDISILEIGGGVFEVRSTHGDTYLGGDDFDERLSEHLIESFSKETGINLREDAMALQRIKEAAERAKHELSSCTCTEVNLPFVAADESGPRHLVMEVTREILQELTADLVERLVEPCRTALADAGLEASQIEEVLLVGGMTRMPAVQQKVVEIFGREGNRSVDPDEVVAAGAAIQAGVLSGEMEQVLLLDVTPLSLGVETQGGVSTPLIPRNTTIPTTASEVFSTTEDDQSVVRIHVVQGEREMAEDNETLGRFELVGLTPAPRGVPQIEVSFEIDANGVVEVSAKDLATGLEQSIQVAASSGLSESEVEALVEEAASHAASDKDRRAQAELRNQAEGLVYSAERTLRDFTENVEDADREALESALAAVHAAMPGEDPEALREALAALSAQTYLLTEKLFANLGAGDGASEG